MLDGLEHQLLGKLLQATTLRQKVIAQNVANQNTPGYRRQVVEFEDLLARALERNPEKAAELEPVIATDELTPGAPDGNNVTLELEMNRMQQNRLLYEAYMNIGAMRMELIRAAIQDDR